MNKWKHDIAGEKLERQTPPATNQTYTLSVGSYGAVYPQLIISS